MFKPELVSHLYRVVAFVPYILRIRKPLATIDHVTLSYHMVIRIYVLPCEVHKTLQTFIEQLLLKAKFEILAAKQISVHLPQPVTQFFIQSDPTHKHYRQGIGKQADIVFKLKNGDLIQNPDLLRLFFIDITIGCPWTFSHGKTYLNAPDAADSQANNKLTTEYDPLFLFQR